MERLSRALSLNGTFFIDVQAQYDAQVARERLAAVSMAKLATIDRIA